MLPSPLLQTNEGIVLKGVIIRKSRCPKMENRIFVNAGEDNKTGIAPVRFRQRIPR